MSHRTLTAIAIVLALLVPMTTFAAGPGFGPRDRGSGDRGLGARFLPPPGYLDFTEEQTEAAQAIRDGVRDQLDAVRDEHRTLREQLQTLLDSDDPAAAEVGQIVIRLHRERDQVRGMLESAEAEFTALLNEEQLGKWENFKELRQSRRHRGPRGERGPGFGRHGMRGPGPEGRVFEQ